MGSQERSSDIVVNNVRKLCSSLNDSMGRTLHSGWRGSWGFSIIELRPLKGASDLGRKYGVREYCVQALIVMSTYIAFLLFQLVTHKATVQQDEAERLCSVRALKQFSLCIRPAVDPSWKIVLQWETHQRVFGTFSISMPKSCERLNYELLDL
eukprot:6431548-Amphidinium_carterae.1